MKLEPGKRYWLDCNDINNSNQKYVECMKPVREGVQTKIKFAQNTKQKKLGQLLMYYIEEQKKINLEFETIKEQLINILEENSTKCLNSEEVTNEELGDFPISGTELKELKSQDKID